MGLVEEDLERLDPHLGLEFTTTVRVTNEPDDRRELLAETGEMRGFDQCDNQTGYDTLLQGIKSGLRFWC